VYNIGFTGGYGCPGAWSGYGAFAQPIRGATQVSGGGGGGPRAPPAEVGGQGTLGGSLTIGSFPAGGLEFKAIGPAVRAQGGGVVPPTPFTSDLSGQDFAKLMMAGWVPVGLALGISVGSRHDDWLTVGQTRWGAGNA